MEQGLLVSIITIVYNGEENIERAIQSVVGQTYKNIEYIVIDGGSTDNTVPIIKKYEGKYAYFVSEKDSGIADAFNKGIKKASGNLIGILNSDDWYEPNAVEEIVKNIGDSDIAFGDQQYWQKEKKDYLIKGNLRNLKKQMSINHPTVFVRAACYQQFGLFDLKYKCAMDYELMIRFLVNGRSFVHVPIIIANMQWGGMSDSKWLIGCKETLDIKNKYFPRNWLWNELYYLRHVAGIRLPKFIQSIGLGFVVKGYRQTKYQIRSRTY
jgi:glycosyltransferase involved in cell wall biosynthesis